MLQIYYTNKEIIMFILLFHLREILFIMIEGAWLKYSVTQIHVILDSAVISHLFANLSYVISDGTSTTADVTYTEA